MNTQAARVSHPTAVDGPAEPDAVAVAATGRVIRFTYYEPPTDHAPSSHERRRRRSRASRSDGAAQEPPAPPLVTVDLQGLRDSVAFAELSPLLYGPTSRLPMPYTYGGLVLNYPAPKDHPPDVIIPVDESDLTESDLLVLTTRPPLDDKPDLHKKNVRRSFTSLEHKLFAAALRPYFPTCSRSVVEVAPRLRDAFAPTVANRARVEYRVHDPSSGAYKARRDHHAGRWDEGDERRTGAYLLYKTPAWPGGPALLAAFGMNGTQTLLWTHFLGTRPQFARVLERPRFLMAEIELQDIPPGAESLRFADSWNVEVLLDYPLD